MTYEEKLKELIKTNSQIFNLKRQAKKISESLFDDFRHHIFDKYTQLQSFGWTQYTPYFNDGDSTIFNANTDYLIINDEFAEDSNWFNKENVINLGQWNRELKIHEGRIEEPNPNYNEELVKAYNEIISFLSNFDNDFYLSKFGDHAEIIVTKNGVNISDCDHD